MLLNTTIIPLCNGKISLIFLLGQFSCQNENFLNTSKILWKNTKAVTRGVLWKRPATLLKRRLWHRCFLVNFVKFLTTPFSQNTSGRLFLKVKIALVLIAGFNPGQTWVLFGWVCWVCCQSNKIYRAGHNFQPGNDHCGF